MRAEISFISLFIKIMVFLTFICTFELANSSLFYGDGEGRQSEGKFCYSKPECNFASDKWNGMCNSDKRQRQSPIDLNRDNATTLKKGPIITFDKDFNKIRHGFDMDPNGQTITISFPKDKTVFMDTGFKFNSPLQHYSTLQFHFHWGKTNKEGSEHNIIGKKYPLEAHIVHMKTTYKTWDKALHSNDPLALAVIGVVFEVGSTANPAVKAVTDSMKKHTVRAADTTYRSTTDINMFDLLPKKKSFYRYKGSLTTPPCFEIVHWIVFDNPSIITDEQLKIFQDLDATQEETGKKRFNWRPIQDFNSKEERSMEYSEDGNIVFASATDSGGEINHRSMIMTPYLALTMTILLIFRSTN